MAAGPPLPTLLSQTLVAFTIDFDNEFEHRMPHRTTVEKGSAGGPWLVSMVMWSNLLRCVGEGVTIAELQQRTRIAKLSLAGMERWGYIAMEPGAAGKRQAMVRPTARGRMAGEVWRPLFGIIEKRWEERFGKEEIDGLRESLRGLASRFEIEFPEYLPVLGYGLFAEFMRQKRVPAACGGMNLAALLSWVLLAFTMDFEREADLSLAIGANAIRILSEEGVRVRDLPGRSGVSKEAMKTAVGFLEKRGYAVVEADSAISRGKRVRLTPKGVLAQEEFRRRLAATEQHWRQRYGIDALRDALERLAGHPSFGPVDPPAEGWRAAVEKPATLPHYPMVLHRGGYPDGS